MTVMKKPPFHTVVYNEYMYSIDSAPDNHKALGNVLVNVFHAIEQYMYVGHSVQM